MVPALRNSLLLAHVVSSVGWVGALAVFLAHAIVSVAASSDLALRAAWLAMAASAWYVILPFALLTLATGLTQSLATPWGLARHYWVLFKLLLTAIATGVLLTKLGPIDDHARRASEAGLFDSGSMGTSMVVHGAGGLVVLLAAAALAIYKPAGRVGRGLAAPRWVRAAALAGALLLAALVVMVLFGGHGPRPH